MWFKILEAIRKIVTHGSIIAKWLYFLFLEVRSQSDSCFWNAKPLRIFGSMLCSWLLLSLLISPTMSFWSSRLIAFSLLSVVDKLSKDFSGIQQLLEFYQNWKLCGLHLKISKKKLHLFCQLLNKVRQLLMCSYFFRNNILSVFGQFSTNNQIDMASLFDFI